MPLPPPPYFPRLHWLCLWLGAVITGTATAQPCTIDIGPDHTICQGGSVTLNGPPGYSNYLWSNGSSAPSITVSTAGNYWVQVSYPSGELAVNGDFNGGNAGFGTQFNPDPNLNQEGVYFIGVNAAHHHPQLQGTGNGLFMMVNAGWMHGGFAVWCQTHPVCPGQTYELRFRGVSLSSQGPPWLEWLVNGVSTGVTHVTSGPNSWQTFTTLWTAPPGVTSANFCLYLTSGYGVGNDIGIDDISISSTIVLTDDVNVNVTPLPPVDLGADAVLCDGESLTLDAAVPGGTYLWQDGSTAPSFQVVAPGNYDVTVTANGCSATDAINVSYIPNPVVDIGPDLILCDGETALLDATTPNATYEWQNGATTPTFTVTAPGIHHVQVTVNGCTTYDEVDVQYLPLPDASLGGDVTICAGDQHVFDVGTPGGTYLWHDGSTGPTYTATTAGNVGVQVTANGCSDFDAVSVAVLPLPVVDLGPDQVVCPGTMVMLDATLPNATYLWQDGSTAATFSSDQPGTYSVEVTVNGCSNTGSVTITNHTLADVDLGGVLEFCEGSSIMLDATTPNASYLWSTGATTGTITVGSPGTHWVDVTLNGCTTRDSVLVEQVPLPVVDLGPDQMLCPGGTTTLDATATNATYLWSNGADTPSISVGTGAYWVEVTVDGCSATGSTTIGEHPLPIVPLGNDTTLCPGEELMLDASLAGASYLWQDGSTGATYLVNSSGNYSVTVTDANGCQNSDAISVAYADLSSVYLGADATICAGEQLVLDATVPGGSYLWSTGGNTPTITVSTSGSYSVIVTQAGCTVADEIHVTVVPSPTVDLGADLLLCPGETVILDVEQAGATYLWTTGATTPSILVDQEGTYSVTVTSANGCTTDGSIQVMYASPEAVDLGSDQTLCEGGSVVLGSMLNGASYLWNTGATTPTIEVSTAGIYWLQVTQGSCSASDTISVDVLPVPQVDLGADQLLCPGLNATLDATWPDATYLWSTGATTPAIAVVSSGNYSVSVDLNGCIAEDEVVITILDAFEVDLGPTQEICAGDALLLDATITGATYLWSTGATTPTLNVTTSGMYWVEVGLSGCMVTDTVEVVVHDPGTIDLGPDQDLCEGGSVMLDATLPGATYLWTDGNTDASRTITSSGTYGVTATVGQCTVSDQVTITFHPVPVADLGADVSICPGQQALFETGMAGATYLWQDGSTGHTFQTSTPGLVHVTVSIGDCSASDTVMVTLLDGPVADLGGERILCEGTSIQFDVAQPDASYLWDDGSTSPHRTIADPGTYWVQVTKNTCVSQDTVVVELFETALVDLGPDLHLCPGETATLVNPVPDAQVIWSTGSTANSIVVDAPGVYWLEATVEDCEASDTVMVTYTDLAILDLGPDQTLCVGDSLLLSVDPQLADVLWSTGATTPTIQVTESGTYTVNVQQDGCTQSDGITVAMLEPITSIDLGQGGTLCPGDRLVLDATLPLPATYQWSNGGSGPQLTVDQPGTYSVHAVGHCVDAVGAAIIGEGECGPVVHLPNAFTPDGNGRNEVFKPVVDGDLANYHLEIFDRWGERIFSSNDLEQGWDGLVAGHPAADGVYVWRLYYRAAGSGSFSAQERMGHVTLLR